MEEPISPRMTLTEYDQLPEDRYRYEVLEGELMMSPAPGYGHQNAVMQLGVLISLWRRSSGDRGRVLSAPFDVVLAQDTIVQPDVLYIAANHLERLRDGRLHGAPDLAVEIFGVRGAARDRVAKLQIYARFGIPEYWLVDLDEQSVTMLELAGGSYRPLARGTGTEPLASRVLAGFTLLPADVFRDE